MDRTCTTCGHVNSNELQEDCCFCRTPLKVEEPAIEAKSKKVGTYPDPV